MSNNPLNKLKFERGYIMFFISKEKEAIQTQNIQILLKQTYWADKRDMETIKKSIENSLCYGAYLTDGGMQIGFARVITDYATSYYICDVIVDKKYRGYGIGKALVEAIISDYRLNNLTGILKTSDAHELYAKYGFIKEEKRFMVKMP